MKRSEAKNIIYKYLDERSIHEIGPTEIFELMNEIGMLPPTHYVPIINNTLVGDEGQKNTWEPEE